ncbi:SDR family NAD(P)-dependent oxidoreductase [Roseospira marina]|uniref:SDR family NAD(P)-dependent oxidoreductase n=1 Tax=Roseospira marina TaxID=140057 RepID=A0A5M6ICW3_9PROT|nr:SDR family NAD(P)-dependent oxidoreductase [Roseospira marina]KAA5606086.1 SDR family NAD(P)-dependent oxidoreductase [Roseospira marina]MBB4313048.1 NAD(P)-dependent dehydrogenase (short-subunit alcohol dehydrogenase family) [Roseospira marina]MBB5086211.1 NAD(P)-dependent dehydrogenase (short-subunit alcohol dehydrogenase family) [Roseospira marina]
MTTLTWIIGAGRGIGRALALALAREGGTVVASARNVEDLKALAGEAEDLPGRIVPQPLDVTDRAATARALAEIEARDGLPDTVVLNAGTHASMPAARFDARVFDRLVGVNLMGAVNGLDAVIPRFVARRRGHIAVVGSVAGYVGLPTAAAYSATKAAVIALCESLRPDLAQFGVRVQVINPGFVRTPLTDQNTFPMPFLMEPDAAARRIVKGLRSSTFEITMPRRLTWLMKLLAALPYPLLFALTRRAIPDEARPDAIVAAGCARDGEGS